ncbi:hypothetical protein ACIQV3_01785 [Streptomyces sp. NPDC099050]|uniref:hypothetical protein n=1 Tax=Streptomyces sp. NPDC099050 TaxID=3366100 RepID=UPI00382A7B3E
MVDPGAVAQAAGAALVAAAGTDAWTALRQGLVRFFSRSEPEAQAVLLRLEGAPAEVAGADPERLDRVTAVWRTRFEAFLGSLPEEERAVVEQQLRDLLPPLAGEDPAREALRVVSGRDTSVRAEDGSVAAVSLTVNGGLTIGHRPPAPGQAQG